MSKRSNCSVFFFAIVILSNKRNLYPNGSKFFGGKQCFIIFDASWLKQEILMVIFLFVAVSQNDVTLKSWPIIYAAKGEGI